MFHNCIPIRVGIEDPATVSCVRVTKKGRPTSPALQLSWGRVCVCVRLMVKDRQSSHRERLATNMPALPAVWGVAHRGWLTLAYKQTRQVDTPIPSCDGNSNANKDYNPTTSLPNRPCSRRAPLWWGTGSVPAQPQPQPRQGTRAMVWG